MSEPMARSRYHRSLLAVLAVLAAQSPLPAAAQAAYGYTGREADAGGLDYYRTRYDDPAIGRFTQRDPIGLAGGLNDYAYADNDPAEATDPQGLFAAPYGRKLLAPGFRQALEAARDQAVPLKRVLSARNLAVMRIVVPGLAAEIGAIRLAVCPLCLAMRSSEYPGGANIFAFTIVSYPDTIFVPRLPGHPNNVVYTTYMAHEADHLDQFRIHGGETYANLIYQYYYKPTPLGRIERDLLPQIYYRNNRFEKAAYAAQAKAEAVLREMDTIYPDLGAAEEEPEKSPSRR